MTPGAPFHLDVAEAPAGAAAYWLTASDGMRLRAVVWQGGRRGTAVVFPGRSEFAEKYGRVIGELVARELSVVVIDWRGQGLSDRFRGKAMLGHVEDFRTYQHDVAALLALEAALDLPAPRYLVAHSMGGCIGLRTLLERGEFSGAVFSAPMWQLQMKVATRELTAKVTHLANAVGLGARLMPGARAKPTPIAYGFERNVLTSDRDVFGWCLNQITAHPELAIGGPSMQWTYAALEEMARLYVAPLPKIPMLVLMGTEETVVSPSVIRSQVAKMAEGELVMLEGARHEVFMEQPEIREQIWRRIDAFLDAAPTRRGYSAAAGS